MICICPGQWNDSAKKGDWCSDLQGSTILGHIIWAHPVYKICMSRDVSKLSNMKADEEIIFGYDLMKVSFCVIRG